MRFFILYFIIVAGFGICLILNMMDTCIIIILNNPCIYIKFIQFLAALIIINIACSSTHRHSGAESNLVAGIHSHLLVVGA